MELALGSQLTYMEAPGGVHDYVLFRWHEPEQTETLERIAEWMDAKLNVMMS
jgi:hypothetical protein